MTGDKGLVAVILAAGRGTRMKSEKAKVLHEISGRAMINYVVDAARSVGPERIIIIVGHQAEAVMEEMRDDKVEFALQKDQLGTGHAVLMARPLLEGYEGTLMVLTGDTPLLTTRTLQDLLDRHRKAGAAGTVLSAELDDATGYGRIIKDTEGNFLRIVEHKDASDAEKLVSEINSGIFCYRSGDLFEALDDVGNENTQGEYYLTDVMDIMRRQGKVTVVQPCLDSLEVMGINDIDQLKKAERLIEGNG